MNIKYGIHEQDNLTNRKYTISYIIELLNYLTKSKIKIHCEKYNHKLTMFHWHYFYL